MPDPAGRSAQYEAALGRALVHTREWLGSLDERTVPAGLSADAMVQRFDESLPEGPTPAGDVVDLLATLAEPGLAALPSGRFFGFVIGGTLPAALAADWLVSSWDQNAGLRLLTPATAAAEATAGRWLLELLGLPDTADVGFVTGGTMANFTCLAAARDAVLARAGWEVGNRGLTGAPRVRVLAGAERHDTVDLTLRYLGLGAPEPVAVDDQGRLRLDALAESLRHSDPGQPVIVCLQAGNVHSGAFDPLDAATTLSHQSGAWVHIDGAFGLWAGVSPSLRHLVAGFERADSWATDAHKTLNVPYDCGVAIVADPAAMRAAMGVRASYLITDASGPGDPMEKVPELSRRARGLPVWAALRSLGRAGVVDLVDELVRHARDMARQLAGIDGCEVLNDVDYTQVCVAFGDDARTQEVTARLLAEGRAWMSGSRWHDRDVLRVSVSNWSTDDDDVRQSVEAVRRAVGAIG